VHKRECVCVCACVRARVHICVRACVSHVYALACINALHAVHIATWASPSKPLSDVRLVAPASHGPSSTYPASPTPLRLRGREKREGRKEKESWAVGKKGGKKGGREGERRGGKRWGEEAERRHGRMGGKGVGAWEKESERVEGERKEVEKEGEQTAKDGEGEEGRGRRGRRERMERREITKRSERW
jgi:hypothetical protein